MKTFHCNRCGNLVFFENVTCERCNATLGFLPDISQIAAFEGDDEAGWRSLQPDTAGTLYRRLPQLSRGGGLQLDGARGQREHAVPSPAS